MPERTAGPVDPKGFSEASAEAPQAVCAGREHAQLLLRFSAVARVKQARKPSLGVVDVFAGAGGLSLGLHQAGFDSLAAVEMDADSCKTYSASFPDSDLYQCPIQGVDFRPFKGVDLLAGGPPCQPFSSGGKRMAEVDGRNMLPQFLRAVSEAKPRALLMENVFGLDQGPRQRYFRSFVCEVEALGYSVSYAVLNAADFGVPQNRRRLFMVGLRGKAFEFPAPTHGPGTKRARVAAGSVLDPSRVVGEPNESRVVYAKKPDVRPNPYDGHLFNGGGRGVDLLRPAPTILASAGGNKTHFLDSALQIPPYHAHLLKGGKPRSGELEGGRRLTVEESAALQTFPPTVRFSGARSSRYRQVGNAVPPRLAAALGQALAKLLTP